MPGDRYEMNISLNVLNHLGLNLHGSAPAALSEVIANSWDADATEVRVEFDRDRNIVTVRDNGHGMDLDDINDKYLFAGYRKRDPDNPDFRTPGGRKPMGRKGIGKLSLFSIANRISVYTRKDGGRDEAFTMDADEIKRAVENEDPSAPKVYAPAPAPFDVELGAQGTLVRIEDLKKIRLTKNSVNGLRKRIARRFGLLNDGFRIFVDGEEATFAERDYFHKVRFLFQYGDYDYSRHCPNLDEDGGEKLSFVREGRFDSEGEPGENGEYSASGWIAVARSSTDLDGRGGEDNLNKIAIVSRGKVAQEDVLSEFRIGGMITKFLFGEIHADFLDQDDQDDIATSSRQRFVEDDPRYRALSKFVDGELRRIAAEVDALKENRAVDAAVSRNPHIKEWYDALYPPQLKATAKKALAVIDQAGVDERHRNSLYADGITAFESRKIEFALQELGSVDPENMAALLKCLSSVDEIEAGHYYKIVRGRLDIIHKLRGLVDSNVYERELRDYIFEHLWLLDPAWERATEYKYMEQRLQRVVDGVPKDNAAVQLDIRYRRVSGAHVIVELKRPGRRLSKSEIEDQLVMYSEAVEDDLQKTPEHSQFPIESFCIVDELPRGWDNPRVRERAERSLAAYSIRVLTYTRLIDNAYSVYSAYLRASAKVNDMRALLDKVRNYKTPEQA